MKTATEEQKRLFGAVWLWCISHGYEDVSAHGEIRFSKGGETLYFVLDDGQSKEALLSCLRHAQKEGRRVFVATRDAAQCEEFLRYLPADCGVFCSSNPFGWGQTVRVYPPTRARKDRHLKRQRILV